jgi:hypothetical protein
MSRDWRMLFTSWSKPPSETEEAKASRAATMIREAIAEHEPLRQKRTSVYATGSYRNNTNTRLESDIDIAVVLHDCFFSEYPAGKPPQATDLGHGAGVSYGLSAFRDDVSDALVKKFGRLGVSRGTKAFDVHANSVRLDADVAVFLEHHRYTGKQNADGTWHYLEGVEMRGLNNARIINWHAEHYSNGIIKNDQTCRRYKRVARILKRLRDDMQSSSNSATRSASNVPSFLLECLAFNASDDCYQRDHLYDDVRAVIAQMWNKTKPETEDLVLVEVSGLKWLFGASQAWSKGDAHAFLLSAWQHVGFR